MVNGIVWTELFPTKLTIFIFIGYISLFISQGILVTASQDKSNRYNYDIVSVVLLTEVLKLVISIILYCKSESVQSLVVEVSHSKQLCIRYLIPSFLYCIYNNLAFINLSTFDPTTYYLLLQLRVVITGILFQIIFQKFLSRKQWFSLILLTIGCMIKQIDFASFSLPPDQSTDPQSHHLHQQQSHHHQPDTINHEPSSSLQHTKNTSGFDLSLSAVYILIQLFCSCLAGIYNEYLLKGVGANTNIYVQNVLMYFDSIVCNVILLILQGNFLAAFNVDSLRTICTLNVMIIMVNNAAIGIVTCFFLKYLNSILKTFASALELMFTAVLCNILFHMPIHVNTMLSIGVVSFAIYLYSLSPVVNATDKGKLLRKVHNDDDHDDDDQLEKLIGDTKVETV